MDNQLNITHNFNIIKRCTKGHKIPFRPHQKIKCLVCNETVEYTGDEHKDGMYLKLSALKLKNHSELKILYPISLTETGTRIISYLKMFGIAEKNIKKIKVKSSYARCDKCKDTFKYKENEACPKCKSAEVSVIEVERFEVVVGK